ncbi:MAG TPA: hypothetical protein HA356_07725 [Candidatus Poseidoniaceae archaeon]|nr:hypothetical protein [Candidatus Poseidoniaceae archaeon]|tara:strand:- start:1099 stop:1374 length:276 start_codon:yes stop_codon:yes gene_type:complete
MKETKALRKVKKLTSRLTERMEEIRDLMDDMEIEFEMLQKQITVLEKHSSEKTTASSSPSNEESEDPEMKEEDEEELDLENTTSVFVKPKF